MRIRTVLGFAVLSIVSLSCSGDGPTPPPPPPPPPVTTIQVFPPTSGMVGDTAVVMITATNASTCTPIVTSGATLLDSNGCTSYRIILGQAGTAIVSATAVGSSGTKNADSKQISILPRPVVTFIGQIILVNGQPGEIPKEWLISAEVAGEEKVSTLSNSDGTYTLPSVKGGPVREAILTLVPPPGSRYGPLYLATTTEYSTVNMKWTVIPNQWRIGSGIHTGENIPVNLIDLMSPPAGEDAYFLTTQRVKVVQSEPFGYYTIPNWWNFGGYPIRVALDRVRSTSPLVARDSIKLWEPLDEFERITGFDYYKPANYPDVVAARKGLMFSIDSTLQTPGGAGISNFLWDPLAIEHDWAVVVSVKIHDLDLFYREDIAFFFPGLVQHEFMHGLGIGHTDRMVSLMNITNSDRSLVVTIKDVAYLELARELSLYQKTHKTRLGLAERLNGMYVLEMNLPPTSKEFLP